MADSVYDKGRRLLPPELRDKWAVVPRGGLYQLFFVGALFGAGMAFYTATKIDAETSKWLGILAIVAVSIQAYLISRFREPKVMQEFLDKIPPG